MSDTEFVNGRLPAFPIALELGSPVAAPGLTKRELFAAMALQGWLASFPDDAGPPKKDKMQMHVRFAVDIADALLAALKDKAP